MRLRLSFLGAVAVSFWSFSASAEVVAAGAHGFTTRHTTHVAASRERVYAALVNDVGKWWNAERTVSGNPASLYIDARVMGCFCEVLGQDAGLVHLTVTFVNPGVMLRLSGGLGPLGLLGVAGNLTFEFTDAAQGTDVIVSYAVGGYDAQGLDVWAPVVDDVLTDASTRLKRFVEQGSAAEE